MRRVFAIMALSLAALGSLATSGTAQQPAKAEAPPTFQPEPFWPKPLPENWILGQVAGIATAPNGNIWVLHRPASLVDDEKGAQKNPPETKCCKAAPPVMEFDIDGNLLRHWGGPGDGYKWVQNEHGLHVDKDGTVWVGGNNDGDQILHFTPDGKFINQIGKDDGTKGPRSGDTARLNRPAHMFTDDAANEIYRCGRLRQSARHRVRFEDRRLQAPLGRLRQCAERRQAGALLTDRRAVEAVRQSGALRARFERRARLRLRPGRTTASRCSRRTASS